MYIKCDLCGKEVKKLGLGAHKFRSHNPDYINPMLGVIRGPAWNSGLTAQTDDRVKKGAAKLISNLALGVVTHSGLGKHRSDITKDKLSKFQINRMMTVVSHPSRSNISYCSTDGALISLQSSYELIIANILDKNGIVWSRPKPLQYLAIDNKIRNYFPDFYLNDFDLYFDPKNDYLIKKDEYKINQVIKMNNVKLVVLNKSQLNWD